MQPVRQCRCSRFLHNARYLDTGQFHTHAPPPVHLPQPWHVPFARPVVSRSATTAPLLRCRCRHVLRLAVAVFALLLLQQVQYTTNQMPPYDAPLNGNVRYQPVFQTTGAAVLLLLLICIIRSTRRRTTTITMIRHDKGTDLRQQVRRKVLLIFLHHNHAVCWFRWWLLTWLTRLIQIGVTCGNVIVHSITFIICGSTGSSTAATATLTGLDHGILSNTNLILWGQPCSTCGGGDDSGTVVVMSSGLPRCRCCCFWWRSDSGKAHSPRANTIRLACSSALCCWLLSRRRLLLLLRCLLLPGGGRPSISKAARGMCRGAPAHHQTVHVAPVQPNINLRTDSLLSRASLFVCQCPRP